MVRGLDHRSAHPPRAHRWGALADNSMATGRVRSVVVHHALRRRLNLHAVAAAASIAHVPATAKANQERTAVRTPLNRRDVPAVGASPSDVPLVVAEFADRNRIDPHRRWGRQVNRGRCQIHIAREADSTACWHYHGSSQITSRATTWATGSPEQLAKF